MVIFCSLLFAHCEMISVDEGIYKIQSLNDLHNTDDGGSHFPVLQFGHNWFEPLHLAQTGSCVCYLNIESFATSWLQSCMLVILVMNAVILHEDDDIRRHTAGKMMESLLSTAACTPAAAAAAGTRRRGGGSPLY